MAAKMSGWLTIGIIILVVVGGWYWYMKMYPKQTGVAPQTSATPTTMVKGQVLIKQNTFIPDMMTIKVGETVTWVNEESYGHDVISDDGTFKSPKLATGDRYSYTFMREGTYTYICSIHPFMHASIVVTK